MINAITFTSITYQVILILIVSISKQNMFIKITSSHFADKLITCVSIVNDFAIFGSKYMFDDILDH